MKTFLLLAFLFALAKCIGQSVDTPSQKSSNTAVARYDTAWILYADPAHKPDYLSYINLFGDETIINTGNDDLSAIAFKLPALVTLNFGKQLMQLPCYPGDTAYISYTGKPQWLYRNRQVKALDTSFMKVSRYKNLQLIDSINKYKHLILGAPLNKELGMYVVKKKIKDKGQVYSKLLSFKKHLTEKQAAELDSLLKQEKISPVFYLFYKPVIVSQYMSDCILAYTETGDENYVSGLQNLIHETDSLLDYDAGPYKAMLKSYIWSVAGRNVAARRTTHAINKDYTRLYDSASSYLTGKSLSFARYYCLSQIRAEEPDFIYQKYLKRFKEDVTDTALLNYVGTRFARSSLPAVPDLVKTSKGLQFTLTDLILENRGKYILIDLWASWCVPCRQSLQAATPLLMTLNKSKVKLIFLSLDNNSNAWMKAEAQHGLAKMGDTYIFDDARLSVFLKTMKVATIPRYVLLDQQGEVLYREFPGIDSEKASKIFRQLELL